MKDFLSEKPEIEVDSAILSVHFVKVFTTVGAHTTI